MTYKEALDFISAAATPGSVYGLERIRALLERLGRPQDKLRFIHIAGTNGKGSVSRMLSCILTAAGYRVGCFNSPFLVSPCEYLSISLPGTENYNPVSATEEEFAKAAERIMEATLDLLGDIFHDATSYSGELFSNNATDSPIASHDIALTLRPTAFEYYTAMAIDHFARKECDFAIMECGLGGKDDSTNVIPSPEIAVITRIGLDHTEMLGDTISAIAAAKAGIIKKGCSVVAYPSEAEAISVIRETCNEKSCPISVADPGKLSITREGVLEGDTINYDGLNDLKLSLMGSHQALNAAVVIETVKALRLRGESVSDDSVRKGLAGTVWPARLTLISSDPPILVDGAHNPQCMGALCETLSKIQSSFSGKESPVAQQQSQAATADVSTRRFIIVTGVMADKDYKGMYKQLAPYAAKVIAVKPDNPRSLDPKEIVRLFESYNIPAVTADSVVSAVESAKREILNTRSLTGNSQYIGVVVTGSLYMMKGLEL